MRTTLAFNGLKSMLKKFVRLFPKVYRPISLFQIVSKMTEKLIIFEIEDYDNKKKQSTCITQASEQTIQQAFFG